MSWKGPSYGGWRMRSFMANKIITQNTDMMKLYYPKSSKARLITIGVDCEMYKSTPVSSAFKKEWGINNKDRIIITVANLVPVKGIEILIESFKKITNKIANCKLFIVGDDSTPYASELKKNVTNDSKLAKTIIFTGRQNNIVNFLNIAEIYVQPTLNKVEWRAHLSQFWKQCLTVK